jgi:AcrR family transcriptional regulator
LPVSPREPYPRAVTDPAPIPAAPGEDPTRDRLIEAAAAVFAEKGYDGAGVQEIARRAGFTTGAIYGRFRGKAELLLAAIEARTHDELEQLFAEHRFEGRAADVITTVGSHLVTEPFDEGQALLLEAFVAARRDPEVAALVRGLLEQRAQTFATLVEAAKANGQVAADLDTEAVVRFCHAVGFGFLLFGAIDLAHPPAEPWERLIARLVDALGDGAAE